MEKNNYLFKFQDFVEESMKEEESRKKLLQYSQYYGSLEGVSLEDTEFYKNYLSKFDVSGIKVVVPERWENMFDYDLLTRLIAASFSSDYELSLDECWKDSCQGVPLVNLSIFVTSNSRSMQRSLKDLWILQIRNLYTIYLQEQLNISTVLAEGEQSEIVNERRQRLLKTFEARKNQILEEAKWYSSFITDE